MRSGLALLYDAYSDPCLLSEIQTYSGIFTSYSDIFSHIVAFLEAYVTPAYSEHCHIENPGIFRTQYIFRTLSRHRLVYSERCVTLAYWEPCPIQNPAIFRILAYLRPEVYLGIFRHIQTYSIIIVIITLTFFSL